MVLPELDIESLTADERLASIERMWSSLSPADVGITKSQHDEFVTSRRDRARPGDAVTWTEAQRRIRERMR